MAKHQLRSHQHGGGVNLPCSGVGDTSDSNMGKSPSPSQSMTQAHWPQNLNTLIPYRVFQSYETSEVHHAVHHTLPFQESIYQQHPYFIFEENNASVTINTNLNPMPDRKIQYTAPLHPSMEAQAQRQSSPQTRFVIRRAGAVVRALRGDWCDYLVYKCGIV